MKKSRQRLFIILFVLASLGLASGLALYALKDNISFFYTPMQVAEQRLKSGHIFRLGGLVKKNSLKKKGLSMSFVVTDEVKDVAVRFEGMPPDLFREGQGVVATGALNDKGVFIATQLLAKHDEKYMPPEVAKGLEAAARAKAK